MSNGSSHKEKETTVLPEPEKTGTQGVQKQPESGRELVPMEPPGSIGGLREPTVEEMFGTVVVRHQQTRELFGLVARQFDRRLDEAQARADKFQQELENEKVEHARTDTLLKAGFLQSSAQIALTTIGGVLLAYGLTELKPDDYLVGLASCLLGAGMIFAGAFPTVYQWWRRRG